MATTSKTPDVSYPISDDTPKSPQASQELQARLTQSKQDAKKGKGILANSAYFESLQKRILQKLSK